MFVIAFVFVAVCALAIGASRLVPVRNRLALLVCTGVFLAVSWVVWTTLLFLNAIPIDAIARSYGVYDVVPWVRTIAVVPPLLGSIVFAIALWRRWLRPRG